MKILLTNAEKLAKAIKDAEGKATARTETTEHITDVLSTIKVPKVHLTGTKVYYDNGQTFPNAYKYRPESTHWTAECIKGKWYITDIFRATCPNRMSAGRIEYSEAAKRWIIDNASTL